MGLEPTRGEETPPVKPAASGGRLTPRANEWLGACMRALSLVAHVGNHLREYYLDVLDRWVGVVALAADQIVLGVQVRIVRTKVVKTGKTRKDSIDGRHKGQDPQAATE